LLDALTTVWAAMVLIVRHCPTDDAGDGNVTVIVPAPFAMIEVSAAPMVKLVVLVTGAGVATEPPNTVAPPDGWTDSPVTCVHVKLNFAWLAADIVPLPPPPPEPPCGLAGAAS
jgi:hypothetical protein